MIDTDKYEPTHIDTLLHYTRAHSPDGWRELSKSLIELSDDDRLLIECAPTLRAEVKRLREELDEREAYIKRLSEQLSRATKWAYKQVLHNDSAMMDFDDYVWGEEE